MRIMQIHKNLIHIMKTGVVRVPFAIAALLIFFVSILAMQVQLDRQRNDFESSVKRALIEGDFQGRLHAYEDLQFAYSLCQQAVEDRKAEIAQWTSFYTDMVLIFADQPAAVRVIHGLQDQLAVNLPPHDPTECVSPVKPERPK